MTLQIAVALLIGLYLGWVVVSALRTGVFRYRGRRHLRAEEPKTFWFGVAWFGVLALVALGYAAYQWFGATPGD